MPEQRVDAEAERYTIDELARASGTTSRNIRAYQTRGLLPPPHLSGRTGYYGSEHLARLRVIASFQERGFSLAAIREMLETWQQGRSLADLLGLETAAMLAWAPRARERVDGEALEQRLPGVTRNRKRLAQAKAAGLIAPTGDGEYELPVPSLVDACRVLLESGVPLQATLDTVAHVRALADDMADRIVTLWVDQVWKPAIAAREAGDRAGNLAQELLQLQRLGSIGLQELIGTALADRTSAAVGEEAVRLREEEQPQS